MPNYKTLESGMLDAEITFERPRQTALDTVTLDSPAVDAMTDLTKVAAMTVNPCASIDQVNERMIASGVRLLFVTNQFHHVIGIISIRDLSGAKLMNYLNEVGGKREDVMVRDLMTKQAQIEVLSMDDIRRAKVGDLVNTLKRMGRQHALVVDRDTEGKQIIRGVLSTSQMSKQLGIDIDTYDVASSIAELAASK